MRDDSAMRPEAMLNPGRDDPWLSRPEAANSQPVARVERRSIGTIRSINGTGAQVVMDGRAASVPTLGAFVTIPTGHALAIGQLVGMHMPQGGAERGADADPASGLADIELVGELLVDDGGQPRAFRRGLSVAPRLGDRVHMIGHDALALVNRYDDARTIQVGRVHQDPTVPAVVEIDEMLGKHFAIVGSTGTGKSCTVALVLRRVLARHPHAHVVLLDPHNEYTRCFGDQAELVPLHKLSLPYWCLTFEELVEILIGDARQHAEEVEVLRELIPAAKRDYAIAAADDGFGSRLASVRSRAGRERFSVDVPLPYRMADVAGMIDTEMGRLDKQRDLTVYKRLKARIQAVTQDPRYGFMFGGMAVNDSLKSLLKQIFRVPVAGKPITVIGLMGLPAEVINVVVSVLARLAFDLAIFSEGRLPITFVCEEAHRYVPGAGQQGFEPTKRAIARIAKEGRKYGASLCVVSQRPADLDPTILSQCSTVFAMRLANERDQAIIGSALADASRALLSALPMLGTREAIVFGEAVSLPTRIVLDQLPPDALPAGNSSPFTEHWSQESDDESLLEGIIEQWRLTPDGLKERLASSLERSAAERTPPAPQSHGAQRSGASTVPIASPYGQPARPQPMQYPQANAAAPSWAPAPQSVPSSSGGAQWSVAGYRKAAGL